MRSFLFLLVVSILISSDLIRGQDTNPSRSPERISETTSHVKIAQTHRKPEARLISQHMTETTMSLPKYWGNALLRKPKMPFFVPEKSLFRLDSAR
jgi:hypothetical protein